VLLPLKLLPLPLLPSLLHVESLLPLLLLS